MTTDVVICSKCQSLIIEIESRRLVEDELSESRRLGEDELSPAVTPPLDLNPPTPRDMSTRPTTSADLRYFKTRKTSLYIKSLLNRHKKGTFNK